jgi:DNA-binding CsgD family transcriptional regulator
MEFVHPCSGKRYTRTSALRSERGCMHAPLPCCTSAGSATWHVNMPCPANWPDSQNQSRCLRRPAVPRSRPVRLRRPPTDSPPIEYAETLLDYGALLRRDGRRRQKCDGFTAQESRVAALVAAGKSNTELARLLSISINTVETHLRHIYVKAGVRSRLELASFLAARDHTDRDLPSVPRPSGRVSGSAVAVLFATAAIFDTLAILVILLAVRLRAAPSAHGGQPAARHRAATTGTHPVISVPSSCRALTVTEGTS